MAKSRKKLPKLRNPVKKKSVKRSPPMPQMRIGFGYDVHQFARNRKLVIGGVTIPYDEGLLGHSDADVLLHAISDALLGSLGLGDIGIHFPNDDDSLKDVSSLLLLARVVTLVGQRGFEVVNIDSTIVLQRPKIAEYVPEMQSRIAETVGILPADVSVKATTNEGMGFIGSGLGCAAYAVVCVQSPPTSR
jgi:2-C-methyl-D-erythritol 2,4-cyclodiphosphate synthase